MSKQSLLALGIPTYKRPDAAIKVIEQALELNIFDQIIIQEDSLALITSDWKGTEYFPIHNFHHLEF